MPRVTGRSRPSIRHFLRHFASFLDMQARDGGRGRGQESHVRFPSKLSEEMRRMCGGLPAYHTVFSICKAPRVEFSAGVLMLTNYCQLLYLIPRLSLSPLSSSPFPPSQQAPARRSRKMSHPRSPTTNVCQRPNVPFAKNLLLLRMQETYPCRFPFLACLLPSSRLSSICLLTNWPNKPGHCVRSRVVHLNLGSPFFARYRRRYRSPGSVVDISNQCPTSFTTRTQRGQTDLRYTKETKALIVGETTQGNPHDTVTRKSRSEFLQISPLLLSSRILLLSFVMSGGETMSFLLN